MVAVTENTQVRSKLPVGVDRKKNSERENGIRGKPIL